MSMFAIDLDGDWLGGTSDAADATFGSLRIRAGDIVLTDVDDTVAKTTRSAIRVPASLVAEWLILHWWRLRWEPRVEAPDTAWRWAHTMASISSEFAWPPLEIASDGEFVQFVMPRGRRPDATAIRYLQDVPNIDVPASDFESAVDRFLDVIEERIRSSTPKDRSVVDLRMELREERADPARAQQCRWQARAGFDAGDAPEAWTTEIAHLAEAVGARAMEDILASRGPTPTPQSVEAFLKRLRRAKTTIDVSGVRGITPSTKRGRSKPWERAAEAAALARSKFGFGAGPVSNGRLEEILGAHIPVSVDSGPTGVSGGLRDAGVTKVLVSNSRVASQRFYFARLLGLAVDLGDEPILPVSNAATAAQQFGRAFAQELLCPWAELDVFTDEHGTEEEAILDAADRYSVSEMMIATILVNHGKVPRERLSRFAQAS